MKRTLLIVAVAGLALTACSSKDQPTKAADPKGKAATGSPAAPAAPAAPAKSDEKTAPKKSPLDLTVKNIDGKDVNLADYKGKVALIVNVASKCGNTPQYAGLEKLYTSRKDKGLVVLGFPANEFGGQEPGTEADIKAFCTDNYHVDFPMFAKVVVKGEHTCELYKMLAAATPGGADAKPLGAPDWNFTKYLINRRGEVIARFKAGTPPDDAKLTAAIDAALAETH